MPSAPLLSRFFVGRDGQDANEVRRELARFVAEVAGQRTHGSTGRRPLEVFATEEQTTLRPLPQRAWEPVEWRQVRVHQDCHVLFERRLYSVPWRLIGQKVWVRATASSVAAYADDTRVATHDRRGPGFRSTVEEHLPEHHAPLRHRSRAYWEERAQRLGPDVASYVREVFDSDDVLSMLRAVQAIVTHLETFPIERAQAACRRARFYGAYGYGAVKNILRQGLDLQPLPTATVLTAASPSSPRFARTMNQLLHLPIEETDEPN